MNIAFLQRKQEVQITLSVPFRPQPFGVSVRLECSRNRDIEICASITGEGLFRWEILRDGFTSRLDRLRETQENNGLEFSQVTRTSGTISRGILSAEVVAFGTGLAMRAWSGWLPHRPSLCLFELESERFIIQVEKNNLDLKFCKD